MMSSMNKNNDELLKNLAIAMVANPRSTIKELADAVKISKATLHRFCGTRDNLDKMLYAKATEVFEEIIVEAQKEFNSYEDGLKELISVHLKNQEFIRFFCGVQMSINGDARNPYMEAITSFFLRGQKNGDFKIELSTSFLSDMFVTLICGVIDAVRYGQVAPTGIEDELEKFFLYGSKK